MKCRKRIFARRRTQVIWKLLVVTVAMTTTMAACSSRTENWSPAQSPKTNKVNWVSYSHNVRPTMAGDGLSKAERRRLDQFSAEVSLGYGDQVVVRTPTRHVAKTAKTLVQYFRARRLKPSVQVVDGNQGRDNATMTVIVGRYVVVPPKCPDWTKQSGPDPSNRASSNFGCATTSNLGLMLADPGDLVRGREKGPGDGVSASRLVRKYREGKVAEPANISTSSGNSP